MRPLTCLLFASACAWAGDAPVMTIRPVQVVSCAQLPSDLPFDTKPFAHELGFKISWLIEGADLIGFKEDGLVITALKTADGKDLSKSRNGKPTWKMDSFPKVSDDGRYAVVTMECSADVFGKVDGLTIAGVVVVLTGSDRQSEEIAFDPAKPSTAKAGPLTIEFGAKGFGFGSNDSLGVKITGPQAVIASLEIVDGAKRLDRSGWSGSGDERTYQFEKPTGPAPKLAIAWWGKTAEVTLPLGR